MTFLTQRHRASGKQSKDLNSGRMDCQSHPSPLLTVPVVPPSSGFSEISTGKCWAPTVYQVPCWVCHLASSSVLASPRRECSHFRMEAQKGKELPKVRAGHPGLQSLQHLLSHPSSPRTIRGPLKASDPNFPK